MDSLSNLFKKLTTRLRPRSTTWQDTDEVGSNVAEWLVILVVGLCLLLLSIWYSVDRFFYWGQLEEHVLPDGGAGVLYDTTTMESILDEYESKRLESEGFEGSRTTPAAATNETESSSAGGEASLAI